MFLLQHVVKGRQYYYQHISLTGRRGEVFLVTAMESRGVGNVTVLVRFESGNEARVKTDHLHLRAPKSPAELRQIQEAKWRKEELAEWERHRQAQQRKRRAQQRKKDFEKEEKVRAKRQHLEAQKRRRALEEKEKARAKRQRLQTQKRKRASKTRAKNNERVRRKK